MSAVCTAMARSLIVVWLVVGRLESAAWCGATTEGGQISRVSPAASGSTSLLLTVSEHSACRLIRALRSLLGFNVRTETVVVIRTCYVGMSYCVLLTH